MQSSRIEQSALWVSSLRTKRAGGRSGMRKSLALLLVFIISGVAGMLLVPTLRGLRGGNPPGVYPSLSSVENKSPDLRNRPASKGPTRLSFAAPFAVAPNNSAATPHPVAPGTLGAAPRMAVPVELQPAPRQQVQNAPAATPRASIHPRVEAPAQGKPANQPEPSAPARPSGAAWSSSGESRGSLGPVDCRAQTFVLYGPGSLQKFSATSATTIYQGLDRVTPFCALQRLTGSPVLVAWKANGRQRLAGRIDMLALHPAERPATAPAGVTPAPEMSTIPAQPPVPSRQGAETPPTPPEPASLTEESGQLAVTLKGVVTAATSDALLVVSDGRPLPVAITDETRVTGLRPQFRAISRFDIVRISGYLTRMGTLVARQLDVVGVPDIRITGKIRAVGPGFIIVDGFGTVRITGDTVVFYDARLRSPEALAIDQDVTIAALSSSSAHLASPPADAAAIEIKSP
jgi:hypothetical protein